MEKRINRILVIRPDALGDVILMIPLIQSLKKTYPHANIYTLQQAYSTPLLQNHPCVKDVIIDKKKTGEAKGIRGFFSYVKCIKSYHFDLVIHSFFDTYYALLCVLAGIPIRVGDSQKIGLRCWINKPVKQYFRHLSLHEVEQNIALLKEIEPHAKIDLKSHLPIKADATKNIELLLKHNGWLGEPLIGIHPATGGGNRAWLPEKYAALIDHIHKYLPHKVVLTGFGDKEKVIIDSIVTQSKRAPIVLYQKTNLDELGALLCCYDAIIGTDTGPTHMAATLQVPVLCISPTKFVKSLRWGPWKTPNRVVGHPEHCPLVCNPHICQETLCLDAIPVDTVFSALKDILDEAQSPLKTKELSPTKQHWLRYSCTLGFYFEHKDDIDYMKQVYIVAKKQGFRTRIILSNARLKPYVADLKQDSVVISKTHINTLRRYIMTEDINIWHIATTRSLYYWYIMRQWVALGMYVPPIIIRVSKQPKLEQLDTFYLQAFQRAYTML